MTILTPYQDTFLRAFSKSELRDSFHLTGGTALAAFYLQHRLSDDLDFFTADASEFSHVPELVQKLVQQQGWGLRVERSFRSFFDADILLPDSSVLKIDFAVDAPFRLKPRVLNETYGIYIENDLDIGCNKLSALFDRIESKDFVDIYFILQELFSWDVLYENASKKHVGMDPHFMAKALMRVLDINVLPHMVKPLDLATLRPFYTNLARQTLDRLKS